jgi:hypothetical protein
MLNDNVTKSLKGGGSSLVNFMQIFLVLLTICILAILARFGLYRPSQLPPVVLSTNTLDLGTLEQGIKVIKNIDIQNTSDKKIIWRSVSGSCGCTIPTIDAFVGPHGHSVLQIIYDSTGRIGEVAQFVALYATGYKEPVLIDLSGKIVKGMVVQQDGPDANGHITLFVEDVKGSGPDIKGVETSALNVVAVRPISNIKAAIDLMVKSGSSTGSHDEIVKIRMAKATLPEYDFHVEWNAVGAYQVKPENANFGLVDRAEILKRSLLITGGNVSHLRVFSTPRNTTVAIRKCNRRKAYLDITCRYSGGPTGLHTRVLLSTSNSSEPRITVPIYAISLN